LQAPLYLRDKDFDLLRPAWQEPDLLQFTLGDQSCEIASPPMGGQHQLDNLAAALTALALLNPGCLQSADEISDAIRSCSVPGRLQKVASNPEVLLDVGHNALAAAALASFLESSGRTNTTCVLAMLADKSAEDVALSLGHVCKRWLCADSASERGQTGEHLAQRIGSVLPNATIDAFGSLADALQQALASVEKNETILVFGSFLTVSAAAQWLQNSLQHDGHDADRITTDESVIGRREKPNG
jgi:dihydrofolate synthase/folylpolyglutamate synthase